MRTKIIRTPEAEKVRFGTDFGRVGQQEGATVIGPAHLDQRDRIAAEPARELISG